MGNVFNRYGAGGGKSEGLYLWKKYGLGPDVKVLTSNYNDSWASDYQFSRTIYESTEYEFVNGKYQLINPTAHTVTGTAGANSYGAKAGHFYVVDENPAAEMFEVVSGCTYPPSWIIGTGPYQLILQGNSSLWSSAYKPNHYILGHVMVGYVVSDKEDAYPDKEVKDGYYYEKMALSLETFGCTKFETGSFTMTSDEWLKSITHSMGVKPLYAIAWTTATTGATRIINSFPTSGAGNAIFTWNNNANHVNYSGQTSDTTSVTISTRSNTYYVMKAGSTYHYILMA